MDILHVLFGFLAEPPSKGKGTMSGGGGGGSTGRGKSQPKTDPKYHLDYLLSNYSVDSLFKV